MIGVAPPIEIFEGGWALADPAEIIGIATAEATTIGTPLIADPSHRTIPHRSRYDGSAGGRRSPSAVQRREALLRVHGELVEAVSDSDTVFDAAAGQCWRS